MRLLGVLALLAVAAVVFFARPNPKPGRARAERASMPIDRPPVEPSPDEGSRPLYSLRGQCDNAHAWKMQLIASSGTIRRYGYITPDRRYRVDGLPAGEYELGLEEDSWFLAAPTRARTGGNPVVLRPREKTRFRATVRDAESGDAIPAFEYTLYLEGKQQPMRAGRDGRLDVVAIHPPVEDPRAYHPPAISVQAAGYQPYYVESARPPDRIRLIRSGAPNVNVDVAYRDGTRPMDALYVETGYGEAGILVRPTAPGRYQFRVSPGKHSFHFHLAMRSWKLPFDCPTFPHCLWTWKHDVPIREGETAVFHFRGSQLGTIRVQRPPREPNVWVLLGVRSNRMDGPGMLTDLGERPMEGPDMVLRVEPGKWMVVLHRGKRTSHIGVADVEIARHAIKTVRSSQGELIVE